MNREIKFRAWDVVNKKMHYYAAFVFEQFPYVGLRPAEIKQRVYPFVGIESSEMITGDAMGAWQTNQYTGLNDKIGREIWEGDIVKYYSTVYGEKETEYIQMVEFTNGGFSCGNNPISVIVNLNGEVIGNIYQNPELLK